LKTDKYFEQAPVWSWMSDPMALHLPKTSKSAVLIPPPTIGGTGDEVGAQRYPLIRSDDPSIFGSKDKHGGTKMDTLYGGFQELGSIYDLGSQRGSEEATVWGQPAYYGPGVMVLPPEGSPPWNERAKLVTTGFLKLADYYTNVEKNKALAASKRQEHALYANELVTKAIMNRFRHIASGHLHLGWWDELVTSNDEILDQATKQVMDSLQRSDSQAETMRILGVEPGQVGYLGAGVYRLLDKPGTHQPPPHEEERWGDFRGKLKARDPEGKKTYPCDDPNYRKNNRAYCDSELNPAPSKTPWERDAKHSAEVRRKAEEEGTAGGGRLLQPGEHPAHKETADKQLVAYLTEPAYEEEGQPGDYTPGRGEERAITSADTSVETVQIRDWFAEKQPRGHGNVIGL